MICRFLLAVTILCQLSAASELKFESADWVRLQPALATSSSSANVTRWALIVAGSNGWYNYRHQADACHAYQIVKKNGIPEENIVLMMYDDIAQNSQNPTKGIIINHLNGSDVYHGVKIDYKGEDVTPQNFLAALSGKSDLLKNVGTGKVIKSGPNDHLFVNFVDHGAPGILAFPSDELHVEDLMKTVQSMYKNKQYGQMVFYVEACESGSMFTSLPKNINVYATTAANPQESSYACYYDSKRGTYLGDTYSVNWMEDSDVEDLHQETLHKQYQIVKERTNESHVMEYGDMSIGQEDVSEFQAGPNYVWTPSGKKLPRVPYDAVPSEEVPLAILYHRLAAEKDAKLREELHNEISSLLESREQVAKTMKNIVSIASRDMHQANHIFMARHFLTSYDCYEPAVKLFRRRCYNISENDYARKQLKILVNLCEEPVALQTILEAIVKVCKE